MNSTGDSERTLSIPFMRPLVFLAALLAAAGGLSLARSAEQEEKDALLDPLREAVGFDALREWKHGLVVEGRGRALDLESRFVMHFLADGRFMIETLSEQGGREGFDGERGWKVDSTGMPGALEFTDLAVRKLTAWVVGGFWLDPACPLRVFRAPGDGKETLRIAVNDRGGEYEARLELDPARDLPAKLVWSFQDDEQQLALEDYREVSGFRFPHRITITGGGEATAIRVDQVREAGEDSATACRAALSRPGDFSFDATKPGRVEFRRAATGHLLIHPLVDGKEAGWFFLDTGAGRSAIDTATADELGLRRLGRVTARGVGGAVDAYFRKAGTVALGPVTIMDPQFVAVDLSQIEPYFDVEIGGALGYDLFARSLVEVDFEKKELGLFEPGAWKDRELPWQDLSFEGNIPAVTAAFEGGREGLFRLDLGSGGTVHFNANSVRQHGLLEGRTVSSARAGGVGGFVDICSGTLEWFQLGEHRFVEPRATFAKPGEGDLPYTAFTGTIGIGFMSRYRIFIDYPQKRIAFVPLAEDG